MNKKIFLLSLFLLFTFNVQAGIFDFITGNVITDLPITSFSCSDSDNNFDIYSKGTLNYTEYYDGGFNEFIIKDSCWDPEKVTEVNSGPQLVEGYCVVRDGHSQFMQNFIDCAYGCEDGSCNGKVESIPKIAGIWNYREQYSSFEKFEIAIKTFNQDGKPATRDQGYNIQYYFYDVSNPSVSIKSYIDEGNYNANDIGAYWRISTNVPKKPGKYFIEVTFYCANDDKVCSSYMPHSGANGEEREKIYFEVLESIPVPEKCTDSDGGFDYYNKGTGYGRGTGVLYDHWYMRDDSCYKDANPENEQYKNTLHEVYCSADDRILSKNYDCPNGCENGACVEKLTCKDSDDGDKIYDAGETYGKSVHLEEGWTTKYDYCIEKNLDGTFNLDQSLKDPYIIGEINDCIENCAVQEFYCAENTIVADVDSCPNGCENGACLIDSNTVDDLPESNCLAPYHMLSPDGRCVWSCGIGTTPGDNGECVCKDGYHDYGKDSFGRRVCWIEEKEVVDNSNQKCFDSDGGNNYNSKGNIIRYSGSTFQEGLVDFCATKKIPIWGNEVGDLIEYSCSSNSEIELKSYTCPNGCEDGKCVEKINECFDSDNGFDYSKKGTVSLTHSPAILSDSCILTNEQGFRHVDSCDGDNCVLLEQGCNPNEPSFIHEKIKCPNGCTDGVCLEEESQVNLHNISIENGNLKVIYSKNFDTCVHIVDESFKSLHKYNFWCEEGNFITVIRPLNFVNIISGQKVKLCHGNNYNICSEEWIIKINDVLINEIINESLDEINLSVPIVIDEILNETITNVSEVFVNETIEEKNSSKTDVIEEVIVETCYDSDEGISPYIPGYVEWTNGKQYDDVCVGSDNLQEHFCVGNTKHVNVISCELGCVSGACLIGENSFKSVKKDNSVEDNNPSCNGCLIGEKCYPYGFRVNGKFCNIEMNEFRSQVNNEKSCENDFECESNICTYNKCEDLKGQINENKNLLDKLFDIIKNLNPFSNDKDKEDTDDKSKKEEIDSSKDVKSKEISTSVNSKEIVFKDDTSVDKKDDSKSTPSKESTIKK